MLKCHYTTQEVHKKEPFDWFPFDIVGSFAIISKMAQKNSSSALLEMALRIRTSMYKRPFSSVTMHERYAANSLCFDAIVAIFTMRRWYLCLVPWVNLLSVNQEGFDALIIVKTSAYASH